MPSPYISSSCVNLILLAFMGKREESKITFQSAMKLRELLKLCPTGVRAYIFACDIYRREAYLTGVAWSFISYVATFKTSFERWNSRKWATQRNSSGEIMYMREITMHNNRICMSKIIIRGTMKHLGMREAALNFTTFHENDDFLRMETEMKLYWGVVWNIKSQNCRFNDQKSRNCVRFLAKS